MFSGKCDTSKIRAAFPNLIDFPSILKVLKSQIASASEINYEKYQQNIFRNRLKSDFFRELICQTHLGFFIFEQKYGFKTLKNIDKNNENIT